MALKTIILEQIDTVLAQYATLRSAAKYDDCSDQSPEDTTALITTMSDTIRRFAPHGSQYVGSLDVILKHGVTSLHAIPLIAGILMALRSAYQGGYLIQVREMIHGALFADFLEMADYLLSEGYKDPAAVLGGGVLEEHLRQLCNKNKLDTSIDGKPLSADRLNANLAGKDVYSKLDQKSVTGWLDLRNKAAHGKYNEYTMEQVALFLQSVRNFMARNAA